VEALIRNMPPYVGSSWDLKQLSELRKISVVDDDELFLEGMECLIRSFGYEVDTFRSAEEYLISNRAETVCLITDVHMPGMDGIELQRRLIAEGCRVPIIFMSADSGEKIRETAMQAGAIGFLTKPFDTSRLEDLLKTVFNS
jgi:FixJ family two-component response regulator